MASRKDSARSRRFFDTFGFVLVSGTEQALEQRVRLDRARLEFGVGLGGEKEGVILQFDDFDQ